MGRYFLASLIAGVIPLIVFVNGCDTGRAPIVQPDAGYGGTGASGTGTGGVSSMAGNTGRGGVVGTAGSGGVGEGGVAGGAAGASGVGGSAIGSGGAGEGGASAGGGAAGVGEGAAGAGHAGAAGSSVGGPVCGSQGIGGFSATPVAGTCCAASYVVYFQCTADHQSLGSCIASVIGGNYVGVWRIQACMHDCVDSTSNLTGSSCQGEGRAGAPGADVYYR